MHATSPPNDSSGTAHSTTTAPLRKLTEHVQSHRLRYRLLSYILLVSSAFTLIGTGIQLFWEYRTETRGLHELLQQIEDSHLEGLIASQWLLDDNQTRAQLNGILRLSDVLFVELQPPGNDPPLSFGRREEENPVQRTFLLTRQHRGREVDLGQLTVVMSLEGVYRRLRERILIVFGIQAIKTFATAAFIVFFVQALVTRHLQSLAAHARRVSLNQLDEPLSLDRKSGHRPDELDRLAEALEGMRKRLAADVAVLRSAEAEKKRLIEDLEEKNAEMARFNYTISHDLKNPLVTIKNFLGLIKRDLETGQLDRLPRNFEHMDRAANRLHRLLDELFELSRIGYQAQPFVKVNLGELVEEALQSLAMLIETRNARILTAESFPAIECDIDRLREVIRHLVENALHYHGGAVAPEIEIGWRPLRDEHLIFVSDNGLGIEPRFHQKIFEIFERLDPEISEGTGIGLTLVKRIIESHGGRIWVESEGEGQGQGSIFYFTLPIELPSRG